MGRGVRSTEATAVPLAMPSSAPTVTSLGKWCPRWTRDSATPVASGVVPGVKPLLPGNVLVTFLFAAVAGAATGGVAGPRLEEAEVVMREAGAMEAAPVEAPIEKGKPRPGSG